MIEDFGLMIASLVNIMQIEFTIWGFTFSFWQVMLFNMVAGIVVWIITEVFLGD